MRILFFAPHSAIWVHAFPEALVAEALTQEGHHVVYVTCGEALQTQCVAMAAFGRNHANSLSERKEICDRCTTNSRILRRRLELNGYDLAAKVTDKERRQIDHLVEGLNSEGLQGLEIDGVPVGRYALYEFLLHRKKGDLNLTAEELPEYRAAARGALVALYAGRRILAEERPERIITYNSLYAVNRVMSHLAERHGALPYFLHAGGNLSRRLETLMLGRDHTFQFLQSLVKEWPRFRDLPCSPALIKQITDHLLVLFSGKSVFAYSSAAGKNHPDIRTRYGVAPNQRLLVATMSSPDERFAGETIGALKVNKGLLFPKQLDWIRALISFAETRPDLFLLIRIHPREFPNKREQVRSHNARLLAEALEGLPANVAVNWPSDEIALYDLANHTDVFLNAWSSAGKEMALLGVPVVSYSPDLFFYPTDLNYVGTTTAEFFGCIDRALADGWSLERSRAVYRWLAVEYSYGLIDISDSYNEREGVPSIGRRIVRRARHWLDREYVQKRDCSRRAKRLASATRIADTVCSAASTPLDTRLKMNLSEGRSDVEDRAIRMSLTQLGRALFGAESGGSQGPLARRLAALGERQ